MRASAVVVLQNLVHEDEEIEQPPLRQGGTNRRSSVPFAQDLVADVRMDHITV
jgi:hypothetical protein